MEEKFNLYAWFLSLFINLIFIWLLFSSLEFSFPTHKEIKVKLISSSLSNLNIKKKTGIKTVKKRKILKKHKKISATQIPQKRTSKIIRKKEKLPKKRLVKQEITERENELLTQKLAQLKVAQIKKKILSSNNPTLSEKELALLKQRLLSLENKKGNEDFGDSGGISLNYLLLIKRKLQQNFEVPIYLRRKRDLYALVLLKISSQGEIINYKFIKKSPEEIFNEVVKECLKLSSPLPVNRKITLLVEFKAEGIGEIK